MNLHETVCNTIVSNFGYESNWVHVICFRLYWLFPPTRPSLSQGSCCITLSHGTNAVWLFWNYECSGSWKCTQGKHLTIINHLDIKCRNLVGQNLNSCYVVYVYTTSLWFILVHIGSCSIHDFRIQFISNSQFEVSIHADSVQFMIFIIVNQ